MKVKLAANREKDTIMMRDVYSSTLISMAEQDERIVVLDADLMNSMSMKPFQAAFPERTFNCGVQEANMIGVAAGLSATGKIPFAHSFGPFATRRAFDQVFISAAYAKLNVKIVGSDPGITAAFNGGTHMPFEDMGIMRVIPEATILEPVDNVMLKDLLLKVKDLYGLFYIRLLRKEPVKIYEEGSEFEIGKGIVLKEGKDLTIITSGILVHESLNAAEALQVKGIDARVVNMFTWKPVDKELIERCAAETGAIVTVENHNIISGLGSAVAETLAETCPVPMERVGCIDRFGEVGPQDYLQKVFGMTAKDIEDKAYKVLERKADK
ncbi:MAG: transketolase family protein [Acetivibrionales bacterium]|jgi:transketolase